MRTKTNSKRRVTMGQEVTTPGEVSIRLLIVKVVGLILIFLAVGGIIGLIFKPGEFGNYWTPIFSMISDVTFGFIGYIVGQRVGP